MIQNMNTCYIHYFGLIEAGLPSPAEEELADQIDINEWINDINRCYILELSSESMKEAGLLRGDYVIIERIPTSCYKSGDIVVAAVDGEYQLRFYRTRKGKHPYLESSNDNHTDITLSDEMTLHGKLRTVVRKYD